MLRYWTQRTQMRGVERLVFLFWLLQGVLFIDGVEEAYNDLDHSADSDGDLFIDGVEEADNEIDQSADSDGVLFIDGVEEADNEIDQSADSDEQSCGQRGSNRRNHSRTWREGGTNHCRTLEEQKYRTQDGLEMSIFNCLLF
ncbi:putative surface protein SACOL0050 isoform X4 [Salvelinus alpinus]|uniref:putative surface protein SACOL0050 isoform X4 n=1 Tax=Salvelinus alpinus TaxID=8036 RepID=UPI0039FBAE29